MTETITCPSCGKTEGLVVFGMDAAAMLGRYATEDRNACKWVLTCFECDPGKAVLVINDEARDEMFGTGWRSK